MSSWMRSGCAPFGAPWASDGAWRHVRRAESCAGYGKDREVLVGGHGFWTSTKKEIIKDQGNEHHSLGRERQCCAVSIFVRLTS